MDNVINSVKYNGVHLSVTGTLNNWMHENVFSFESCDDALPGMLEINGTDWNSSDHCRWAGLLLHCTAGRNTSPWHNFVSDNEHWTVATGATPCQGEEKFAGYFQPYCSNTCNAWHNSHFISSLNTAGAKKIWGSTKTVVLTGSP